MYKQKIQNYFEQWKLIWRDSTLPSMAKVILEDIRLYRNSQSGKAWPSIETLAKNQGMHRNGISPYIKTLNERKLLIVTIGRGNRNIYQFCEALSYPAKNDENIALHTLMGNYEAKNKDGSIPLVGEEYFYYDYLPKNNAKIGKLRDTKSKLHTFEPTVAQSSDSVAHSTVQELNPITKSRKIRVTREENNNTKSVAINGSLSSSYTSKKDSNLTPYGKQDSPVKERETITPTAVDEINVNKDFSDLDFCILNGEITDDIPF